MKQSLVTQEEPEAAEAPGALPGRQGQALLQARHPAAGRPIQARPRLIQDPTSSVRSISPPRRSGRAYRSSEPRSPRDYEGREPILVASLKTSVFFLADLSRAMPIPHAIDFIALAGYAGRTQQSGVRLIKDLDVSITGRDVLLVEDVVDTGLTLNYVCRTLALREPASLSAVTFLDRPYRRLVDDLPVDTSASRSRTSSSSATASTSTSATGTCRTCTSSPTRLRPRSLPSVPAPSPRRRARRTRSARLRAGRGPRSGGSSRRNPSPMRIRIRGSTRRSGTTWDSFRSWGQCPVSSDRPPRGVGRLSSGDERSTRRSASTSRVVNGRRRARVTL